MDPIAQNVYGVQNLIGSRINKVPGGLPGDEGVTGEKRDEFTLDMTDEELLELSRKTKDDYEGYRSKIEVRQQANKTYYLGRQLNGTPLSTATTGEAISANLIFEAEETFLPAALSKNPEPVVWSDNTTEGQALSNAVKTMLQYHADVLVLRRKLTLVTRKWSVDLLGVLKHGWDAKIKDIQTDVRSAKNLIFEKDGYIDSFGDYDGLLGEQIEVRASVLIDLFPKHKEYITIMCNGQMGTKVTYTEWWTDEFCFYTFKEQVLDKHKNPHYNYDKTTKEPDQDGEVQDVVTAGRNHFGRPKKPYTFLSVFSFEEEPYDVTGLIEQNIPNQKRVSRRTEQLDYNLSRANNSDVFSEDNFNEETATQAARALAKGNPVLVPSGRPISEAIARLQAPGVGSEFFKELENSKQDLRTIFGTQGITATPQDEDQTARGMILNQSHDTSRIGGGIGDALEQVADNVFNWWVQLYYVYYDQAHTAGIMGQMKSVEYVTLQATDLDRKLVISVSADSMKPRDEVTEMNQAISLFEMGALDPKTLLTVLNVPDPQKTSESTVLWLLDKSAYLQLNFPELAQQLAQIQQQQQQAQIAPIAAAGGAPSPEATTEPGANLSQPAASSALSNVPLGGV